MNLTIRGATAEDAPALTALMHASSAYAGEYARILEGYAVTPEQLGRDLVMLAEQEGRLLGFYSLITGDDPELDLMFVIDEEQGTGLGRTLFEHMKTEAAARGITTVTIVSHPPSTGFYERMGAVRVGERRASGRVSWTRAILELAVTRSKL